MVDRSGMERPGEPRGFEQGCHAREYGHLSWIPSVEELINENSWHQGARNLETQGRDLSCYYARYPAAGRRSRANVFEATFEDRGSIPSGCAFMPGFILAGKPRYAESGFNCNRND